MIEELGLKLEDSDLGTSPVKRGDFDNPLGHPQVTGVMMFVSFGAFGLIPLVGFSAYLIFAQRNGIAGVDSVHEAFLVTCVLTLLTLFILGVFKVNSLREVSHTCVYDYEESQSSSSGYFFHFGTFIVMGARASQ